MRQCQTKHSNSIPECSRKKIACNSYTEAVGHVGINVGGWRWGWLKRGLGDSGSEAHSLVFLAVMVYSLDAADFKYVCFLYLSNSVFWFMLTCFGGCRGSSPGTYRSAQRKAVLERVNRS